MLNEHGQMALSVAAAFAAWTALAVGPSGAVLSNAELLRSSGNVTGNGFGTSSVSFALSSGSVGVLDWSTLNVGSGESLKFGNGVWYNAVSGSSASQISGSILGSGANVYLFNPNGIFFSSGSSVDVGSFTAAGFAMSNLDDLIDDPSLEPALANTMPGSIEVSGATFGSGGVNLIGRSVFVDGSTFGGSLSIGAGSKVAVDSVGGGTVSFRVGGSSGDASFVDSNAGRLNIKAAGNVQLESSEDLTLGGVSANKNVSAVAGGAVSVEGVIAAKRNIYVSAEDDVTWTAGGMLHADGNVCVESTSGGVTLGDISAAKASVKAAGDVTGYLGTGGDAFGEGAAAMYRIDADGTVLVSLQSATVDVRGRQGVTLETADSLTIAPVDVSTVRLWRSSDGEGKSTLVGTKVNDAALGGYQSPDSDISISAPRNLTVNGTIRTLGNAGTARPDSIRLEAERGDVSVGGVVSAKNQVLVEAGHDIVVNGSIVSDGALELTAGNAVALGNNPHSLVSKDVSITVDAKGDSTRYEGGSEDGTLVLTRTKKGTKGKLTSTGAILLVDGSVAGGAPTKVAMMQELEAVAADGNSALSVRDPHAALSSSPFDPSDISTQLPGATNEVVRDETALTRATKEKETWTLKDVRK